jgi:hypothetical protein
MGCVRRFIPPEGSTLTREGWGRGWRSLKSGPQRFGLPSYLGHPLPKGEGGERSEPGEGSLL